MQVTATSANHIANMAKEELKFIEQRLKNLRFYDTSFTVMNSNVTKLVNRGIVTLSEINSMLDKMSKLTELQAILREGIKRKENMQPINPYRAEYDALKAPKEIPSLTKEEVLESWSVSKRAKYYALNADCASYGKSIHPEGVISEAREKLFKKINNPTELIANGTNSVYYEYTPSVDKEDVETLFFSLQNKYRKIQAEYNSMNAEIEDTINETNRKNNEAYEAAFDEYWKKRTELSILAKKTNESEHIRIKNTKIDVPEEYVELYKELSNRSK